MCRALWPLCLDFRVSVTLLDTFFLGNPSISVINGTTFEETFFGRIRPLNTTLDFGWISSGGMAPHLKTSF